MTKAEVQAAYPALVNLGTYSLGGCEFDVSFKFVKGSLSQIDLFTHDSAINECEPVILSQLKQQYGRFPNENPIVGGSIFSAKTGSIDILVSDTLESVGVSDSRRQLAIIFHDPKVIYQFTQ